MTDANVGNSEVTTFSNPSVGLLTSSDVQLDAWSRLCFRPQVTASGNAPALVSTLERAALSHCEMLHGSCGPGVTAIRSERMTRAGLNRNACRVLVGKPKGNTSFGWGRSQWGDNIKMGLK